VSRICIEAQKKTLDPRIVANQRSCLSRWFLAGGPGQMSVLTDPPSGLRR
jgi:hypothetical protein